jgi:cysteine protease ATG4
LPMRRKLPSRYTSLSNTVLKPVASILASGLVLVPQPTAFSKPRFVTFPQHHTNELHRALVSKTPTSKLHVYVRPNDSDIYADSLIAAATDSSETFHPTLILLGVRLGIDRITPVYHAALAATLELPHCIGIAGGRPASSHYFIGHQGGQAFFYLDPHSTRSALPLDPSPEDIASCHTRRVRKLGIAELDPSMLLGFLVRSREEFEEWRKAVAAVPGKAIIHVHDTESKYATGPERPGAVDEVEAWETGDEEM